MKVRRPGWMVLACLVSLFAVAPAPAAERNYWKHSKGHFENVSGKSWTEKAPDGTFKYMEVDRTTRYVELYNKDRDHRVRLFDDRCMVKSSATGQKYEKYYDGRWGR